jgi:hypothetical protein
MDYTNNPTSNQHPNQHDYNQLLTIYSHLDSTTTVGSAQSTTPATADNDTEPGNWGRLVASSKSGHSETYELDLGNGKKVITHVTWTLEHPRGR